MSAATRWGSRVAVLLAAAATPACAAPSATPAVSPTPMAAAVARGHKQLRLLPHPARHAPAARAEIAIIIDDLGEQHLGGVHALNLPGPVALAFLPGARFTPSQAAQAQARGKEVLLHLPLQPGAGARPHPTALRADASREQLAEYFRAALASVPHASGVNNHQGSLVTQMPEPMDWLMREVARTPGLYFVDSRTSGASTAFRAARRHGIPSTERNVFLDTQRGEAAVRAAFRGLVAKALRNERALAIGHPYPETFKVLAEELPQLARAGVRLVAPSELIARQSGQRGRPLKLSPSLVLAATPAAAPGASAGGLKSFSTTPAAAPSASAGGLSSYSTTPATTTPGPAAPAATTAAAH